VTELPSTHPTDAQAELARARGGDDAAFSRLVAPLRRELHAHCYRMLGSAHDADDALQEALLRAWRGLARFEGRGSLRSWLYTVATRSCLDVVERRGRRAMPVDLGPSSDRAVLEAAPQAEVAWLGPYPDAGLAEGPAGPVARYEQREAVELAFVAALQHLPGNQRAALLLFDVLGFSAAEIAAMMDTTATSVNSALAQAGRGEGADRRERPTGRGLLRRRERRRAAPELVGHRTDPARGADRRDHLIPRRRALRRLRAPRLAALTRAPPGGGMGRAGRRHAHPARHAGSAAPPEPADARPSFPAEAIGRCSGMPTMRLWATSPRLGQLRLDYRKSPSRSCESRSGVESCRSGWRRPRAGESSGTGRAVGLA
jgi:RNA polymerase sigma factor (sigma-70 family)